MFGVKNDDHLESTYLEYYKHKKEAYRKEGNIEMSLYCEKIIQRNLFVKYALTHRDEKELENKLLDEERKAKLKKENKKKKRRSKIKNVEIYDKDGNPLPLGIINFQEVTKGEEIDFNTLTPEEWEMFEGDEDDPYM